MTLREYINVFYDDNVSKFALFQGVGRTQVYRWLAASYIVEDSKMYREVRRIYSVEEKEKMFESIR